MENSHGEKRAEIDAEEILKLISVIASLRSGHCVCVLYISRTMGQLLSVIAIEQRHCRSNRSRLFVSLLVEEDI